jgi:hypothetical protein
MSATPTGSAREVVSQSAGGAWGSHVAQAGGGVTAPEAIQTVLSPWQPRADGPPTHRV